jgi:hypothetical protein
MVITSKSPQPNRPVDIMESERISVRNMLSKATTTEQKDVLCAARVSDIVQRRLMPTLSILRAQLEAMRVAGVNVDSLIGAAEQSVQRQFGSLAVDLGTILNLGEANRQEELAADEEEAVLFGQMPHPKLETARQRNRDRGLAPVKAESKTSE